MEKLLVKTPRILSGDCSDLRGDCSDLRGDCSDLRGDCSGLRGDCSGLWGDFDDCKITEAEREAGVYLTDLFTQGD